MISKKGLLARRRILWSKRRGGKLSSSLLAASTIGLLLIANPKAHASAGISTETMGQSYLDGVNDVNSAGKGPHEISLLFNGEIQDGSRGLEPVRFPPPPPSLFPDTCGTAVGTCAVVCAFSGEACACVTPVGTFPGQCW
jgi:hypothetical protein